MTDRAIHTVSAVRVDWRSAASEVCGNDIHESYSADRISENQPVRKPFEYDGQLWICTSISGAALTESGGMEHEAYRLMPTRMFAGKPTAYREKVYDGSDGENARNDANGFYHGMQIRHGKDAFVMIGPPAVFVASDEPARPEAQPDSQQMELFA